MNYKVFLTSILLLLLPITSIHAKTGNGAITMNLPAGVILSAMEKSLPLDFKLDTSALLGSVSIDKIENLQFRKGSLSSRVSLSGHQLNIVTSIAGQNLRMKIGSLSMSFQCEATIHFDAASQTLFIKPQVTDLQSSTGQKADIASAIVLLFNNREFPFKIGTLKPFVKNTGNKLINVAMNITDVKLEENALSLHIIPYITVTPQMDNAQKRTPQTETSAGRGLGEKKLREQSSEGSGNGVSQLL